ncbi:S41 family peptidase [Patescibacteria group bacterium]|nr:S41 family peptidase [Patescibacteria group bacterium]
MKVNGQDISALTLPEVVNLIRGPKGTKVTLNVLHSGGSQSVDVVVTRDTIILQSVSWKVINKSVVYLNLARFGDQTDLQWDTTVSQIADYLATSSAKPVGLVLDVRNNPGGLLDGAVYTASEFLPSGVVVTQQGTTGNETFSVNRTGKLLSVPMVVLVNGGTASAGEILAGALQAAGRAKLVGDQTFGKGSVQQAEDLPDGTGLHVTVAKWLLSNGNWINGKGLTPDVKVENNSADPTQDLQLDKAVQVILSPSS